MRTDSAQYRTGGNREKRAEHDLVNYPREINSESAIQIPSISRRTSCRISLKPLSRLSIPRGLMAMLPAAVVVTLSTRVRTLEPQHIT